MSYSPTTGNMKMSRGRIECGLTTSTSKTTARGLALPDDVETEVSGMFCREVNELTF